MFFNVTQTANWLTVHLHGASTYYFKHYVLKNENNNPIGVVTTKDIETISLPYGKWFIVPTHPHITSESLFKSVENKFSLNESLHSLLAQTVILQQFQSNDFLKVQILPPSSAKLNLTWKKNLDLNPVIPEGSKASVHTISKLVLTNISWRDYYLSEAASKSSMLETQATHLASSYKSFAIPIKPHQILSGETAVTTDEAIQYTKLAQTLTNLIIET